MSGNLRPSKTPPQNNPHVCTRKRKMHGSRRGSVETCSTEASSEHVIAESERTLGHSTSTLPSTPLASSSSPSRANWKQMARESPHDFTISANYSTTFSCVSLDPPISQAVLSEIDIQRFKGDLFLRHHLNFEPRVEIRVSTQEPQAEERRERAREYWHTLAIEIAFCSAHCQRIAGNPSSRPLRIFPPGTTLRLPRLFAAVRDMLKRSLPFKEWSIIDERLDVSFLMQQLERGDCEFVALSDWLGNFLRQFCSPAQGYLLHTMTSAIRFGIENANVESTVHGLIIMLEILQEMTLDALNYSLRRLHLVWVTETIAFEQNDFLRRIAEGWDVTGAQIWFKSQAGDEHSGSGLWVLVKALTDAVIFYHETFPPTLILDHNRLRILQLDFQALFYQAACQKTLEQTLESIGWTGEILPRSDADLFLRVAVLISDQQLPYDYGPERKNVALEIVKAAYKVCSNRGLPISEDLNFAYCYLRRCCNPNEPAFGDLQGSLAIKLKDKVDEEMRATKHLTTVQLMRRLLPQKPPFAVGSETEGLINIAKRISHIAELHWRIWGPILYEQPVHVGGRAMGHTSLAEEGLNDRRSSPSLRTNEPG